MKKPVGLAAALMLTLALGACSGDDEDAYCGKLEDAQNSLEDVNFDMGSQEEWDELTSTMEDIAEDAPSELEDDWANVTGVFDDIQAALDDAGVSIDDLAGIQESGELPEGVELEDLQALEELATAADDAGLQDSLDAIAQDAEERCGITLDEGN
jgi:hypothetical protein